MDSVNDDILRQAADGDMEAFEQVYRTYSPFVYNVALRMVEAREDAEEVTQEVFLIVHSRLKGFLFRSSIKTWVYRITVNCSINCLNKRTRGQKGRVDFDDTLLNTAAPNGFKESIDQEDRELKVRRFLGLLNPDERACVVLREIEGLSYEEVARSLGANINTVRTRLKRARAKMAESRMEVINDG